MARNQATLFKLSQALYLEVAGRRLFFLDIYRPWLGERVVQAAR